MAESYSVEAFLKADHTGFVRGFQVAAQAARDFQRDVQNLDTSGFENAGRQFEQVGGKMQNTGKDIMKTGGMITAAVTLPLVGLATAAVRTGMDFESSMSNVQAISGATGDDLASLEKKAREMGASTSKSAGEAADAMSYMALAGWDTTQIMDGIEPVLRLSEAGSLDLARASDLVTDSMSALGIETKDLPGYLDQVAQTSRKANTDIDALMEASLAVGGSFKNLGVPLAEGNALLGIMANRGIKGAEAGNALSSILVNMTSGAGQAGKAMEELGVSAFDSEGNFKGVEAVLLEVKEATAGLSEEQQTQYLSMIAGKTQLSGFQALLDGLGNEYGDLKADIEGSNGALNDMAATMQNNLKGKLTEIGSALSELGIKVYQALLPYLQQAAEMFLNLVNRVNGLSPQMQALGAVIALVAAAVGPLIVAFGAVITFIGMLVSNFGILLQRFAPLIARHAALKTGVGLLGRAFSLLLGPIGLAISIIMALIPVFIKLYQENETVRNVVTNVWEAIKTAIQIAIEAVKPIIESLKGAFQSLMPIIELIAGIVGGALVVAFGVAISIFSAVAAAIGPLIGAFMSIVETVANVVMAIVKLLTGDFQGAMDYWNKAVESTINVVKGLWEGVVAFFATFVQTIIDFFHGLYMTLVGNSIIPDMVEAIVDWFENLGTWVIDLVKSLVSDVVNWFKDLWTQTVNTFNSMKDGIQNVWNTIKSVFETVVTVIVSLVRQKFDEMKSKVSDVINNIKSTVSNVWDAIKGVFSSALSNIASAVSDKFNAMRSKISDVTGTIKSTISTAWDTIKTTISNAVSNALTVVSDKFDAMKRAVSTKMTLVRAAIRDKWNEVMSFLRGINLFDIGKNIIQGLVNGVKNMGSTLVSAAKGVVNSAIDGAKNLLGIRSPSRVFMGIGDDTMAGFVKGIDGMAKDVVRATTGVAAGVTKAFDPDLSINKTDYSSHVRDMNGQLKQQLTSQVSSQLSVSQQPAQITLALGNRSFKAFVEDITNGQTQQVNLVEQYGGV